VLLAMSLACAFAEAQQDVRVLCPLTCHCVSQIFGQQGIDWVDFISNWTIVGTHFVVCFWVDESVSNLLELSLTRRSSFFRALFTNRLTGPIPETLGQLTVLTLLYVFGWLWLRCRRSTNLFHAGVFTTTSWSGRFLRRLGN
jgi:hypothetical protein